MRARTLTALAWLVALAGYWLPWLTHPAAALRLNGYELSEWVTFLPGVRDGSLPLSRLLFLAPLACLAGLGAVAAGQPGPLRQPYRTLGAAGEPGAPGAPLPRRALGWRALLPRLAPGWGWPVLGLATLCALVVLPPYPYLLTAVADPEFRLQLVIAVLALLAVPTLVVVPAELKSAAQLVLALFGVGLVLWGAWAVRAPAGEVLGRPWPWGLGLPTVLVGLGASAWLGLARLFGQQE